MSDDDTVTPETDAELRARLRTFALSVERRTDTEAALERMPHRSRPPTVGLLAVAACLLAVVALAVVLSVDRDSVLTVPPAEAPTTSCPSAIQPRAITRGEQMKNSFALPVASAATAILLLGACGDDGGSATATTVPAADPPTVLAKGVDVEMAGDQGLGGQTLNVDAQELNGEASGEFRITDTVITVQCATTAHDGFVIVAGEVTEDPGNNFDGPELLALIVKDGDPDRVALVGNGEVRAKTCTELLDSISDGQLADAGSYDEVSPGSDIQTV
jgi:hypothetical protein